MECSPIYFLKIALDMLVKQNADICEAFAERVSLEHFGGGVYYGGFFMMWDDLFLL